MLNKLAEEIHQNAVNHGFWDKPFDNDEILTIKKELIKANFKNDYVDKIVNKLDEERSFAETLALVHAELSEALEEYRENKPKFYYKDKFSGLEFTPENVPEKGWRTDFFKPEGIYIEIIDGIIRSLDYLAHENVDIDTLIRVKMEYNKTRPYKHGKKI